MPREKDHCRSCGTTVSLEATDDQPATGVVCDGCKKTVCVNSCLRNSCPHADYPRNPGSVSEAEHEALKAELNDEAALEARLTALRASRGEQKVGL